MLVLPALLVVATACGCASPPASQQSSAHRPTATISPITAPAAACAARTIKHPGIVAVGPQGRRICWTARPETNFYPLLIADAHLIGVELSCGRQQRQRLVALDARTGALLWTVDPGLDVATVTAEAGVLVAFDQNAHRVEAMTLRNGKRLWTHRGLSMVADATDLVAATVGDEPVTGLLALDRRTGQQRWRIPLDQPFAALAADDDAVLVTSETHTTAYQAATGAKLWTAPVVNSSDTMALRITRGVATGSEPPGAGAVAYDVKSGRLLWRNAAMPADGTAPTEGNVYVQSDDGITAALDARTGRQRWKVSPPTGGYVQVEAGPGLVVATTGEPFATGSTQGRDPATGALRWEAGTVRGIPDVGSTLPGGFELRSTAILPSAELVYVGYGNCLSGD